MAVGAAQEGVVYFVDRQLSLPAQEALLLVRYLVVDPPYVDFYSSGLAALEASSQDMYPLPFEQLGHTQQDSLIGTMGTECPKEWNSSILAPLF